MDADGDQKYGGGHRRRLEGVEKIATLSYLPAGMNAIWGCRPKSFLANYPVLFLRRKETAMSCKIQKDLTEIWSNATEQFSAAIKEMTAAKINTISKADYAGLTRQSRGEP